MHICSCRAKQKLSVLFGTGEYLAHHGSKKSEQEAKQNHAHKACAGEYGDTGGGCRLIILNAAQNCFKRPQHRRRNIFRICFVSFKEIQKCSKGENRNE